VLPGVRRELQKRGAGTELDLASDPAQFPDLRTRPTHPACVAVDDRMQCNAICHDGLSHVCWQQRRAEARASDSSCGVRQQSVKARVLSIGLVAGGVGTFLASELENNNTRAQQAKIRPVMRVRNKNRSS
jgi:hypothetical protein